MGEMTVKDEWLTLFVKHGREVEEKFGPGNETYNWLGTEFACFESPDQFKLTLSERKALYYIKQTFDIERLRRPGMGVDFVYGNVGFEVKSTDYYTLSKRQQEHSELLEAVFVVICDGHVAKIDDVIL